MQKIVLNVIPDGVYPKVYVNQFDIGRQFQIKFKEDFIPYDFPNSVTFRINGRKADNHVFEYTESDKYDDTHYVITKSGSGESLTITISTTEQMTAAAGDAEVQLTYKDSANRVQGTLNFILAVQERPASVGDPSESDLPDIVRSVNGITPDADGDVQLGATGTAAIGAANISPVEQTRTMRTAYSAGDYVYVATDDQLYKVISPIGSGGTLTPGTNAVSCQLTSDLASYERIGFGTCDYINGTSILAVMDNIEASGTTPINGTLLALNATDAPTSSDNYMIVFYGYHGTARKILEAFQYNTGKKYHCILSPVNSHYINLTGWLED